MITGSISARAGTASLVAYYLEHRGQVRARRVTFPITGVLQLAMSQVVRSWARWLRPGYICNVITDMHSAHDFESHPGVEPGTTALQAASFTVRKCDMEPEWARRLRTGSPYGESKAHLHALDFRATITLRSRSLDGIRTHSLSYL